MEENTNIAIIRNAVKMKWLLLIIPTECKTENSEGELNIEDVDIKEIYYNFVRNSITFQ
jgi:hypothetical protein